MNTMSKQEFLEKFNPSLRAILPLDKFISIKEIDPKELICHRRFDLIAKYIYAKYREMGIESDWHVRLYLDHIRVFNGFVEQDGNGKHGKEKFLASFDSVLDSIKVKGFDPGLTLVPMGRESSVHEGAHRAAACLYYNRKPTCAFFDLDTGFFNFEWFRQKGLPEKWLDAIATELCRLLENSFIAIVYPSAVGKDTELCDLIRKYGKIWYRKEVNLNGQGPLNLIRQVYWNEPWVGSWKDGFGGAQNKASWCFEGKGPVRVFIIESDLKRMQELKSEIRKLYAVENHSVHINDRHDETMLLAGLLLNNNSVHFMNNAEITEFKWYNRLFSTYRDWLDKSGKDAEEFCIDSSAVLSAYGIREARDLDFLHSKEAVSTGYKEIGCHNSVVHHYGKTVDDIVHNPENHFYYSGLKFASIDLVRQMKEKRNEEKDREDVRLIDSRLAGVKSKKTPVGARLRRLLSARYLYQRTRFVALKGRFFLTSLRSRG